MRNIKWLHSCILRIFFFLEALRSAHTRHHWFISHRSLIMTCAISDEQYQMNTQLILETFSISDEGHSPLHLLYEVISDEYIANFWDFSSVVLRSAHAHVTDKISQKSTCYYMCHVEWLHRWLLRNFVMRTAIDAAEDRECSHTHTLAHTHIDTRTTHT